MVKKWNIHMGGPKFIRNYINLYSYFLYYGNMELCDTRLLWDYGPPYCYTIDFKEHRIPLFSVMIYCFANPRPA